LPSTFRPPFPLRVSRHAHSASHRKSCILGLRIGALYRKQFPKVQGSSIRVLTFLCLSAIPVAVAILLAQGDQLVLGLYLSVISVPKRWAVLSEVERPSSSIPFRQGLLSGNPLKSNGTVTLERFLKWRTENLSRKLRYTLSCSWFKGEELREAFSCALHPETKTTAVRNPGINRLPQRIINGPVG
jgi:hypothetical protein